MQRNSHKHVRDRDGTLALGTRTIARGVVLVIFAVVVALRVGQGVMCVRDGGRGRGAPVVISLSSVLHGFGALLAPRMRLRRSSHTLHCDHGDQDDQGDQGDQGRMTQSLAVRRRQIARAFARPEKRPWKGGEGRVAVPGSTTHRDAKSTRDNGQRGGEGFKWCRVEASKEMRNSSSVPCLPAVVARL